MLHFDTLWNAHPVIRKESAPQCHQGFVFAGECAINMGIALSRCGLDTTQLPGVEHCRLHESSEGHTLYAEELAEALTDYRPLGLSRHRIINPDQVERELRGQVGIVFVKSFLHRHSAGQDTLIRHRPGDLLDLWNGHKLTSWTPLSNYIPKTGQGCLRSFADIASEWDPSGAIWF